MAGAAEGLIESGLEMAASSAYEAASYCLDVADALEANGGDR